MEPCGHCPICRNMYASSQTGAQVHYHCTTCGDFLLTDTAIAILELLGDEPPNGRAVLSHSVAKMQGKEPPALDSYSIEAILKNAILPSLREQENNLLLFLGNAGNAGHEIGVNPGHLFAVTGCMSFYGLDFMLDHLQESGLLTHREHPVPVTNQRLLKLKMKGWDRYDEIRRGSIDSKKAFMAMPFGDSVIDEAYRRFKSAVAQTGFDLRRLDEHPKAGLIDDRLRVEIATSRFLIAELTDDNNGAYWEAGFAEGLGKPVIYTCEKSYFQRTKTHFDTNHHLTVRWEADRMEEAVEELKATIRATLPAEAKLQD
jgi:hypothetical protein